MTKIAASLLGLLLFSNAAFAVSQDEQVDLDLEAAALIQIAEGQVVQDRSFFGFDLAHPFAFLDTLKDQIASVKDTLLTSFDTNGNGKIDAGPEFDGFKSGISAIVLLVADSNQNGKIDADDLAALSKLALTKVEEETLKNVCPVVYKQVDLSGAFIAVRPVLKQLNDVCLAKYTPAAE